jgi:GR25 family glycosyltransferase involved in LPS biosynthesis
MNNKLIDQIYIINLKKNAIKKQKCLLQFKNNNITNFKFTEAIDTISGNNYKNVYTKIIKSMTPNFIKYNFTRGALGCLLSHIECLKDAKLNNYKQVLILEDDFIMINKFEDEFNNILNNVDNNWDFIYLGKKQGYDNMSYEINDKIHTNNEYINIKPINNYVYRPNYKTWATHAILIKDTIFDDIINFSNNILGPIDLMLMTLYPKYNFYAVKKDLFISEEEFSDVQDNNKIEIIKSDKNLWNWDYSIYQTITTCIIKNIIIYGLNLSNHTHHYIHNMYFEFFKYYYPNLNIYWVDDTEDISEDILKNSIIFCSPCHDKCINMPKRSDIFYILHLDIFDNIGYKNINSFFDDITNFEIYNNKKYIILLCREQITNLNYFEKNIDDKTISLPWFSNNLYNEVLNIKHNLSSIYKKNNTKKYLCYMGSIWSLNIEMIKLLIKICIDNKIYLLLKGRMFNLTTFDLRYINTNKSEYIKILGFDYSNNGSNENNLFEFIDDKFGVKGLLPLQGYIHNNNYISNRVFETISKGYLVITNNYVTKQYFTSAIYDDDIEKLILIYINILANEEEWVKLMNRQINEFLSKFYGYKNINSIIEFIKEINISNNKLILFDNIKNSDYSLWFIQNNLYTNDSYLIIKNNKDIRNAIVNKNNYIIYPNENYDIFLIEQLLQTLNYNIYINSNLENKDFIVDLCNKYNKMCTIKPIK